MINNVERVDPYGDDPASARLRAARALRQLTALDEGQAFRQRRTGALAVLRLEVFASPDSGGHRAAWQDDGVACLDALWRQRWRERDREPGWIEARWVDRGAVVDWITVEDHTDTPATDVVVRYEHLSVWSGRTLATVTIRHDQGQDVSDAAERASSALAGRLGALDG